ncbi:MAG: ATP-dependent protease ATPase subunit HslU [Longimicrobiales bacterium]|nr:ATP-dependent protease ATPase subunit HslU [Longimicrobiales bacterium]
MTSKVLEQQDKATSTIMENESKDSMWLDELTPRQIVSELDKYFVGQDDAKKAVAIVLRNRWRRQQVEDEMREEIAPSNMILIGTTGVGKTEIARRLARLANAPFLKVEASKFTEVGYVGRDVESMIRDLVDISVNLVRANREYEMQEVAEKRVDDRILDLLLPALNPDQAEETNGEGPHIFVAGPAGVSEEEGEGIQDRRQRTREKLRQLLLDGKLDEREIEVDVSQSANIEGMMIPMGGAGDGLDHSFTEMLQDMLPKRTKSRVVTVAEARRILIQDELDKLVDMDEVVNEALYRAEEMGIVFLDEIDKVVGARSGQGPDVSREGVQRDLLPIVEGSTVTTKYGLVRTDHILFIAAGAFHVAKPSDLIPELQGRFPIRVELQTLVEKDFVRILKEPKNALLEQYRAMIETEGSSIEFSDDGVAEIAHIAMQLNDRMENIGARRLQTVMTTLLEDVLFKLPESGIESILVDQAFVQERLEKVATNEDLSRYIL